MRKLEINDEDVIKAYAYYENTREVAREFNCSDETIRRILERHGVPRTHRHANKKPKKYVRTSHCNSKYCPSIIRMLKMFGYSNVQIAEAADIPLQSVCETVRRKCSDLYRPRYGVNDVDLDTIEAEYLDGATTYELGDKYGVHPRTIGKWMRKLGHVRGKGFLSSKDRQRQVETFLAEFPDKLEASKDSRRRAEVRRQYRIASRPHDGPTTGLTWQDIARRNGGNLKCWICGDVCDPESSGDKHPSVDHIIPLSNGGTDTYDNVRIACLGCNRDRNNRVQMTLDYLMYESR